MVDCTPPADNPFPAIKDPRVALGELNAAIAKAEISQRYKVGDRELERGDLRWMYPERKRLEQVVAKLARGGIRIRRIIPL